MQLSAIWYWCDLDAMVRLHSVPRNTLIFHSWIQTRYNVYSTCISKYSRCETHRYKSRPSDQLSVTVILETSSSRVMHISRENSCCCCERSTRCCSILQVDVPFNLYTLHNTRIVQNLALNMKKLLRNYCANTLIPIKLIYRWTYCPFVFYLNE